MTKYWLTQHTLNEYQNKKHVDQLCKAHHNQSVTIYMKCTCFEIMTFNT